MFLCAPSSWYFTTSTGNCFCRHFRALCALRENILMPSNFFLCTEPPSFLTRFASIALIPDAGILVSPHGVLETSHMTNVAMSGPTSMNNAKSSWILPFSMNVNILVGVCFSRRSVMWVACIWWNLSTVFIMTLGAKIKAGTCSSVWCSVLFPIYLFKSQSPCTH